MVNQFSTASRGVQLKGKVEFRPSVSARISYPYRGYITTYIPKSHSRLGTGGVSASPAQNRGFGPPRVQIVVIAAAHLSPNYSRTLNAEPQSDNVDHNGQLGLVCDASEPGSCCAGVQDRDSHCGVVVWCGLTSQRFLYRTTLIIFFLSNKNLTNPHHTTQQWESRSCTATARFDIAACAAVAFASAVGGANSAQTASLAPPAAAHFT